jgi:O-succinylbenzoate synthase
MTSFIEIFQYDLPLARPLALKDIVITRRRGFIVKVGRGPRNTGYGDIAPLPKYSIESMDEARNAVIEWAELFKGPAAAQDEEKAYQFLLHTPSVLFGTECATLWLTKCAMEDSASRGRRSVPVAGLIDTAGFIEAAGDSAHERALLKAKSLLDRNYKTVKIKVGRGTVAEDIRLICDINKLSGGNFQIRLDANRAWDFDSAIEFARGIEGCPIDFVEEPLSTPERLPDLAAHTGLPIALDESVIDGMYDDEVFMDMRWAKAIILKPTLLGGVRATQELAYEALEHGVQPVISSSYESGIGIIALANVAATLTEEDVAAGLDTYETLAEDVLEHRFSARDGRYYLEDLAAAAATVDTSRMERVFSA